MTGGIVLRELRCPGCGDPLSGSSSAALVYCGRCVAGFEVGTDFQLAPLPVSFAQHDAAGRVFRPFWVFDAGLTVEERDAARSLRSLFSRPNGLVRRFSELGSLRFYCAAYLEDLDAEQRWSLYLTETQPQLLPAPAQPRIDGLVLTQADARRLADDVLLASEIAQADTLRQLDYRLSLADPRVVVIAL